MSIIKVKSKKAKQGFTYKVTFKYKEYGVTATYSKSGFTTKKEAKDHENMIKAEIKENGYLKKKCDKTLNQVYEEFLELGCDKYQANTIHDTKRHYQKIRPVLGDKPIISLDYPTLQRYFNSLGNKGIESNKNVKKALNRVFIHALRMQYISFNPLTLVDVKGVENKMDHEQIISDTDFYILLEALRDKDKFIYYAYAIALEIGFYTGLRVSEILALSKNDIDFNNDLIYANKKLVYRGLKKNEYYATHQMKSKKSNSSIPLAPPLKQALLIWFDINPYDKVVCDTNGNYLNPCNTSTRIKKVATNLNIDFHFHMLRHTFVTNLVNNEVDVKTVQELARHSNINTTMSIYTHIQEEQKKNAINSVFTEIYSKNTPKIN